MDYKEILEKVNNQKSHGEINNKLFWYLGLIQSIELFSQRLNFDQIVYTCMDSINELLSVEKSAIYVLQGDKYILKRQKGYDTCYNEVPITNMLKNFPVFYAGLLNVEKSKEFFGTQMVEDMKIQMIVPLLIEQDLFGFVVVGNKVIGQYDEDNFVMAEALMRLFKNALESYKKYEDIQKINKELDEKVFNLFAINQSSKALLSELDIDKLYSLAIDVFSELTQSSITGFILLDKQSKLLTLKSYRNMFDVNEKVDIFLSCRQDVAIDPYRIILNVEKPDDLDYIKTIFPEWEEMINKLKVKFLVLLVRKEELIGLVTLGESVTGQKYNKGVFELVESLITSTYIAISNAELFEQVNEQNALINRKFEKLVTLNTLMKNINSSKSLDIMSEMVLKTLDVAFKTEKALIAGYDSKSGQFTILNTLGFSTKKKKFTASKEWKRFFEGDTIFEFGSSSAEKYIKKELIEEIGDLSGILISPVAMELSDEIEIYGAVIIFKYRDALISDDENRVIVQTISNHIAPIMVSFNRVEEQARTLMPNYIELFKRDLAEAIDKAKRFGLELEVSNVSLNDRFSFKKKAYMDEIFKSYEMAYPISFNNLFIIEYEKNDNLENRLQEMIGGSISIEKHRLNHDFKTVEEFLKLY